MAPRALRSGDVLGRYVIEAVLGHGGMGSVYRAQDTRLHRAVALKVLGVEEGDPRRSTGGSARILREARIAAKLEHPNVVAIYDVGEVTEGEHAGTAYLAMELVAGRSLREGVGDATLPLAKRLRWLTDAARGLAAAHDRGLVHRDVKPENVVVRSDGVAKVLDFGIAKHVGLTSDPLDPSPLAQATTREGALAIVMPVGSGPTDSAAGVALGAASVHSPSITGEGLVIGTPYYMSPEQMKGEAVDARTDQFSWGVMAYELLCGTPPWGAHKATVQVVAAILGSEPKDPHAVNAEVPPWLAAILLRAMAKRADARFPSMHDVVARLGLGDETPPPHTPAASSITAARGPSSAKRARMVLAAVGLAGIVGATVAVTRLVVPRPPIAKAPLASATPVAHGCTSNVACSRELGAPAVCAASRCVALASPDCHVSADPVALASDATLWLGSLYPDTGPVAGMGQMNERATELARQDFAQAAALGSGGDRVRPIGLVACDDAADADRAAKHLVEDIGVPAIIGFHTGDELMHLSGTLLGPHHTLAVATLTMSPLVTQIPHDVDGPPLVWRTSFNFVEGAAAVAKLIEQVVEPEVRADHAATTRVAFVRLKSSSLLAFSERLFDTLRFNGKSTLDNHGDYREFIVEEEGASPETYAALVARLRDFAPNVIVYTGPPFIENVLAPLEKSWPAAAGIRPRYVADVVFDEQLFAMVGTNRELRKRMFGFTLPSTTPVNARFTLHYNGVYGTNLSRADAPSTAYDGFYVAAYAALALRGAPATGVNLATAIGKLVPPGAPIEVGPSGIYQAFTHLRAGEPIDLVGAGGALDFDLTTGDHEADLSVLCLDVDKHGRANASLESGLVYSAKTGTLVGTMSCP